MILHRATTRTLIAATLLFLAAACNSGPTLSGSFDRSFPVSGHTRLDVSTASGDISITGSSDGQVHIHAEVRVSGLPTADANKKLADLQANPPLEQTPDGVRIGKDALRQHNVSISYTIETPQDTEVAASSASGSVSAASLRGPIKLQSASGSIRAQNIDGESQLSSLSGSVTASNVGDNLRASNSSGAISISNTKGDVRANDQSGDISISKPGARVEAQNTSGNITVQGATSDVKAHAISGNLVIHGILSSTSFWDLKSISGAAEIGVSPNSNFHLLAESASGEIRADIPIIIEEQGKHSLRAQIGTAGGRVEVHTVSGEIHLASN
jgi:DUF4097 and DUF4098 domain-containing protein YvlB